MKRCPKCSIWYFHQPYDVDIIHQCRKSPRSHLRLQKRDEHHFQGSRITLKMDEHFWDQMGINPHQPDAEISHTDFKNAFKTLTDVDWFINLE